MGLGKSTEQDGRDFEIVKSPLDFANLTADEMAVEFKKEGTRVWLETYAEDLSCALHRIGCEIMMDPTYAEEIKALQEESPQEQEPEKKLQYWQKPSNPKGFSAEGLVNAIQASVDLLLQSNPRDKGIVANLRPLIFRMVELNPKNIPWQISNLLLHMGVKLSPTCMEDLERFAPIENR